MLYAICDGIYGKVHLRLAQARLAVVEQQARGVHRMSRQTIRAPGVPVSPLPFSPAVLAGGFVFVSGQASVDETGKIVPATFEGEMRRSFENVAKVLAGAGLELDDVVQVRAYVRDPGDLPVYNKVYQDLFREPYPARTTLTHCLPETLRFEVEAIAQMRE